MTNREFWQLAGVSDTQLRSTLAELLGNGSRTEARIIAHLAELEQRKLHLSQGSESLYAYCIHTLQLSNSEAFYRITAARIARRFPIVFALIEERQLHLTAVCLLRDYLTAGNHHELLAAASHKTKWQVQELLAQRFPRPDVQSRIRKLPSARVAPGPIQQCATVGVQSPVDDAVSPGELPLMRAGDEPRAVAVCPSSSSALPPHQTLFSRSVPAAVTPTLSLTPMPGATPVPASAPVPALARGLTANSIWRSTLSQRSAEAPPHLLTAQRAIHLTPIEPLSESRYRIQLNASAALKGKLDRLRALTSHSNPSGDLALLIERAVDAALEKIEKQRFAKTAHPRPGTRRARVQTSPLRRAHVPNAVMREISERDELRCTYRGTNGCRCTARAFLQVHHEQPWACGGDETSDNLRLLCAAHNRLLAERDFGTEHVANAIRERGRTREAERVKK